MSVYSVFEKKNINPKSRILQFYIWHEIKCLQIKRKDFHLLIAILYMIILWFLSDFFIIHIHLGIGVQDFHIDFVVFFVTF